MRTEFPRKIRAAIIARANGKCEMCDAALKVGEGEVDHLLPVALGGKPEAANGRLLCSVCHKAKTAKDVGRIRKADRQRDKATGAMRRSSKTGNPKSARAGPKIDKSAIPPLPRRKIGKPT